MSNSPSFEEFFHIALNFTNLFADASNFAQDHVPFFLTFFILGFVHAVDDNRDKQVQDYERGDEYEGNKKCPCKWIDFHDGSYDSHRPAFERHYLE